MKKTEHPILFSGPMVQAILRGTKTQTRRVLKFQPPDENYKIWTCVSTTGNKRDEGRQHWAHTKDDHTMIDGSQPYFSCPYGETGHKLWVREAWAYPEGDEYIYQKIKEAVQYKADGEERRGDTSRSGWRPSIHMPRWASRIQLEITEVRVQRLHEINEEDSKAEGAAVDDEPCDHTRHSCEEVGCLGQTHKSGFCLLWESINGARGFRWSKNPWVWAITFRRIKP